jgi:hypothetical protein
VQRLTADLDRQPHVGVPLQSPSPRVSPTFPRAPSKRGEGHGGAMPPA